MVRLIPSRLSSHLSSRNAPSTSASRAQSPTRTTGPSGSPTENKALFLRTRVIKGRNLAAKDRGGTSDPYLVVTLGASRQSTSAVSKTLNPEWNTTFDLPVSGVPLLEAVCWDKDRFGKDYLGELEIDLADLFPQDTTPQVPLWYNLQSKRRSTKKSAIVSGDVQIEFSLYDPTNPNATSEELVSQFRAAVQREESSDDLARFPSNDPDGDEDTSDETDDPTKPEVIEKRKKKLRMKRLRRKSMAVRAYEFTGTGKNSVSGLVFMELQKVTDLPPERNMTRTSFDMDPFVVTSLGRKTLRTRVIRHNLNPVFDEKMVFQVAKHEETYLISFTVMDRDKLSGNDFIASCSLPLQTLIEAAPEADPDTGLYSVPEPAEFTEPTRPSGSKSRFRLPVSRNASATSLSKLTKPGLKSRTSQTSLSSSYTDQPSPPLPAPTSAPSDNAGYLQVYGASNVPKETAEEQQSAASYDDPFLKTYTVPLTLKNKDAWEDKHTPELHIKAKFMPYHALRQQFWRAMLKQYDADDSATINKIELTTMLDTLGSTLKPATINGFFQRFSAEGHTAELLTFDQAVICLEDQLQASQKKSLGDKMQGLFISGNNKSSTDVDSSSEPVTPGDSNVQLAAPTSAPTISQDSLGTQGEEGDYLDADDLGDERSEEHVIEIRECPLCHQPRLDKRSDADIITHIATCASQDWRQVNNLVMGGFVTSSQAQRKWYSKVVTKIGYGGYKLGANSANILVQDRMTGQINEEKMSVYVRLGIRLLYKGLKSREMEKKRIRKMLKSLSIKQGKKYDDPASASQIPGFIQFHQLNMDEVLLPINEFKNFNEFFYRALKPDARPCSAPENQDIIVSPADCRSVVFDRLDVATSIWVKGREFSIERLLGNAYPEDAKRYQNGGLGIFRLAPQDYHRFHVPVDGVMGTPKTIDGEYYTVNPMAIRSALDVYGENIRVVIPIDTERFGRVMFVCIGAMMVGSTVITRKEGETIHRAEELGYFKFGGSTVLLLFEPGAIKFDSDMVDNSNGAVETFIRVGMSIGHHPETGQHTPDMRKADSEITNEQRQEAKRAIGGSLGQSKGSNVPNIIS